MAEKREEGFAHLDLGLGEPVVLGEVSDADGEWMDGVKPDQESRTDSALSAGDNP
jgi:hypothetical protein